MTFTKNTPRDFAPEGFTECAPKDFIFDRAAVSPNIRLQVAKFKGPLGVDLVYRGVPPKAIEDEVESAAAADEGVYDVKLTDSLASKDDETQPPAKGRRRDDESPTAQQQQTSLFAEGLEARFGGRRTRACGNALISSRGRYACVVPSPRARWRARVSYMKYTTGGETRRTQRKDEATGHLTRPLHLRASSSFQECEKNASQCPRQQG